MVEAPLEQAGCHHGMTVVGGLLFSEFFSHLQSAVELLIFNVQRHSQGAQQA